MYESDWQQTIYLILIAVFLTSALFSRRDIKLKKAAKYLAIWSLIVFAAVILYSYRFEFEDFRSRLAGEINPSKARIGNSGEINIKISDDNHYYINLLVNGKKIHFMVDTGASDLVLSIKDAKKVGINVDKLIFNRVYQTANGKSYGASVKLEEVKVGNLVFNNIYASVNSGNMGTSLLGMRFLKSFKKYEFYQDKLILTP